MKLFNFFKKKVEIEEEVQDKVQRIIYGSFYAWDSKETNCSMVWDYKEKDYKVLPPCDRVIGMIDSDKRYCLDPVTGKQFFIFLPSTETEYKSIRAFDIKDILIELDRQKSEIEEERNKKFRDNRVQYLEELNSKVEVDLCNTSMSNE